MSANATATLLATMAGVCVGVDAAVVLGEPEASPTAPE
jgi:hypothetical protein